ncbi:MAG: hypothetical protein AAF570_19660, partial [Bacteroidota bacterium]
PFGNEEHSFGVLKPKMVKARIDEKDIEAGKLILLASSPKGGFQYAKAAAKAGKNADHDSIVDDVWEQVKWKDPVNLIEYTPEEKEKWVEQMKKLEPLSKPENEHVLKQAILLHAADILTSILELKTSQYLTDEKNAEAAKKGWDKRFDFTTAKSMEFFLENIVTRELFGLYSELEELAPIFENALNEAKGKLQKDAGLDAKPT